MYQRLVAVLIPTAPQSDGCRAQAGRHPALVWAAAPLAADFTHVSPPRVGISSCRSLLAHLLILVRVKIMGSIIIRTDWDDNRRCSQVLAHL
jgi:hypothetical protein